MEPSLENVISYKEQYNFVPVKYEIFSDITTPIQLVRKLKNVSKHVYLLESVENQENWGRYSFLGYAPSLCITCQDYELKVTNDLGQVLVQQKVNHPADYLKQILAKYRSPRMEDFPSFTGGLVGYFSYDYIKYSESKLKIDAEDQEGFKDVDLMLFDKVIAFDNVKQKIVIVANVQVAEDGCPLQEHMIQSNYMKAQEDIENIVEIIKRGPMAQIEKGQLQSDFRNLFDKEAYCQMVEKAKNYIYEGDIFQVVLSNRFEADFKGSLFDTYRMLRTVNPSPYMFYFSGDDVEVAGASPETLVKLDRGELHTFPLAGTRPRGRNQEEDLLLEEELLADEKEKSEHNMLVDLGRNDIGKISQFGSVKVEKYMAIERYSHVMHIGSTVRGLIREDKNTTDAIDAILPAGTLSGAPKFRACQIINELENNKRGIYGGAIGYVDFTGNLDTAIAIRIAYKKNGKVFVRSGAGIVADSEPEKEYQECINKAKAVITSINQAQEMED